MLIHMKIVISLLLLMATACSTEKIDRFAEIHKGMTQEEVRSILGSPSSTFSREVDERGRIVRIQRWQYGDTPGTFATGALFSEHPSHRVWAIYFDAEGKVQDVEEPKWTQEPPPRAVPSTIPPRTQ